MNISDLWETVVFRDILGYIVPGTVSLLGLALVGMGFGLMGWGTLIDVALPMDSWLRAAGLVALSYIVAHIQTPLGEILTRWRMSPWCRGRIALRFFAKDALGDTYREAALKMAGVERQRDEFKKELLTDSTAGDRAQHLRRWCDLFVFQAGSRMYSTYIGRYKAFERFFCNLGISSVLLGLGALALLRPSGQLAITQSLQGSSYQIHSVEIVVATLVLIVVGVVFIARSLSMRMAATKAVFELFYVLTLKESEVVRQRGADRSQ